MRRQTAQVAATALAYEWVNTLSVLFAGCCLNVVCLETMFRRSHSSGHLITLCQYLFVSVLGIPQILGIKKQTDALACASWYTRVYIKGTLIPLHRSCVTVLCFFAVSVANNLALGYNVPMPVHIIFRSASLITSTLVNRIVFKKSYPWLSHLGVILISLGVLTSTLVSSKWTQSEAPDTRISSFTIGLLLICAALLVTCFLGSYQEQTYKLYGAHWQQALFYTHFLGLPLFAVFAKNVYQEALMFSESPRYWGIPISFLFLFANTITQYSCIASVHKLSSVATSVTVNLVLTLRKFISLVISLLYFGEEFALGHFFGGILVLLGTLLYLYAINKRTCDISFKQTETTTSKQTSKFKTN